MIAFATLLLGLVAGEVRIDLLVADGVAAIELSVDGAPCARLARPPWSAVCDLGAELAPHRLTAVSFDATGAEVGRAEQLVNVDRRDAELSLVLDRRAESGRLLLRIAAASAGVEAPREVRVRIDGDELRVTDPAVVELPPIDLADAHLLQVEARWSDRVAASRDVVLGGEHGERLTTELTAVPVPWHARREPQPASLAGTVRRDGRPLPVVAVDRGPGELWTVTDPRLLPELARRVRGIGSGSRIGGLDWRFVGTIGRGDDVRLVWPWPERREVGGRSHELFLPSPAMSGRHGGLPWLLYHARFPGIGEGPPRLVDAAAVAGMSLAATERRRAVLVLLDAAGRDEGQLSPAALRRYLGRLRVPLHVWRLEPWRGEGPDPWAPVREVSTSRRLLAALDDLEADLRGQRIAWVEGAWLPTELEVVGESAPPGALAAGSASADGDAPDAGYDARDDARAIAEATARMAATRRAALDAALPIRGRTGAGRLELRVAPGAPVDAAGLAVSVEAGVARWSGLVGLEPPSLDGDVLAVLPRLDDGSPLARRVAGLGVHGHTALGVAVLVAGDRDADELEALALHELAHLLSERAFSGPLPVWLEEGLAEHLARRAPGTTGELPRRRGELVVERTARGVATRARGPLADLLDLARADERGELPALAEWTGLSWREFVDPARRARHYALAGELVGFLVEADPARATRFQEVLARAAATPGLDLPAELADALGEAPTLDEAFRAWLRRQRDLSIAAAGTSFGR